MSICISNIRISSISYQEEYKDNLNLIKCCDNFGRIHIKLRQAKCQELILERMLSMLPEEFQDIYDDTIPEAKEIRKKMGKKVSSVKSYSCAMPMFEDIRKLNYKGQAKVCKTFHQYIKKNPNVVSFFLDRFEETYSRINMKDLEESIEWIGYAVNDMDNAISEIDYNDPMTFFDIEKSMGLVISKELKSNSLKL